MDLTINNNNNTTLLSTTKTPEPETKIQQPKPLSFSNGVLKLHNHQNHHHHAVVVNYKECLKNHAATLGGHALDGCGEFMPSTAAYSAGDPTSLKCAACGCHRNFHRREPEEPLSALEYQPHHRHHPPPPLPAAQRGNSSPNSLSPPPISSAYYPSAPHMLLALSTGFSGPQFETHQPISNSANPNSSNLTISNGKKRFRTKFTQPQKARMLEFAEKVGWRMQRRDEELINEVCREVGVERGVLKVWMHNNKNNFNKRDQPAGAAAVDGCATADNDQNGNADFNGNINNTDDNTDLDFHLHNGDSVRAGHVVATNGSSSSS